MNETKVQNVHIANSAKSFAQMTDDSGWFKNGTTHSIGQQPVDQLNEEQMRVTSIPYRSSNMVIFSGVPLAKNSYKTNSGKYYVTIKVNPDAIPVQPAIGQHWSVKGSRSIEEMQAGDYHSILAVEGIDITSPEPFCKFVGLAEILPRLRLFMAK